MVFNFNYPLLNLSFKKKYVKSIKAKPQMNYFFFNSNIEKNKEKNLE